MFYGTISPKLATVAILIYLEEDRVGLVLKWDLFLSISVQVVTCMGSLRDTFIPQIQEG